MVDRLNHVRLNHAEHRALIFPLFVLCMDQYLFCSSPHICGLSVRLRSAEAGHQVDAGYGGSKQEPEHGLRHFPFFSFSRRGTEL